MELGTGDEIKFLKFCKRVILAQKILQILAQKILQNLNYYLLWV